MFSFCFSLVQVDIYLHSQVFYMFYMFSFQSWNAQLVEEPSPIVETTIAMLKGTTKKRSSTVANVRNLLLGKTT